MPQPKPGDVDTKALGARIKKVRLARGISQIDLAKAARVRPHTMFRYEKGDTKPGSEKLDRIADELGVSSRFLLRGTPAPAGLNLDDEPKSHARAKKAAIEPALGRDEQLALFDELTVSPSVRSCWSMHIASDGAHQRITRVYATKFVEVAAAELEAGATRQQAASVAGEEALNAATHAHLIATGRKQKV